VPFRPLHSLITDGGRYGLHPSKTVTARPLRPCDGLDGCLSLTNSRHHAIVAIQQPYPFSMPWLCQCYPLNTLNLTLAPHPKRERARSTLAPEHTPSRRTHTPPCFRALFNSPHWHPRPRYIQFLLSCYCSLMVGRVHLLSGSQVPVLAPLDPSRYCPDL
jgi:hypothetical protein